MKLLAALVVSGVALVGTSVARADAPGETEPVPVPMPIFAPQAARPSVMANRWALGFSIGSEALAPNGSTDAAEQTQFAIGELALRYRATLHLELEATFGGGRQQLANGGGQGDLQVTTLALGARYRFRPEHAWNWYLSGAVGQTTVASAESTSAEKRAAARAHVALGVGLERRFAHLALAAELRAVGVAGDDASTAMPVAKSNVATAPAMSASGQSGGMFTLGASYYF